MRELERRGSISEAAKACGVGRRTVYDERARNVAFDEAVRDVVEGCIEEVESTLYERARSGENITATIFFLKCRKPEVYGDYLTALKAQAIREQARQEVLAELRAGLRELPPQAREVLAAAIPRA